MLSGIYGQKEIENARKWIQENEISIFLPHRMDMEKMPCITISIGSNAEDKSLSRLSDQTPFVQEYQPNEVGDVVQYIIPPFAFTSYNQATGFFQTPSEVDLTIIQPGMVAFDEGTAQGWAIAKKSNDGFFIAEGTEISASQIGILPNYRIFRARREVATFQERITIGCHVHGDPNALLWLYSIMMYGFLRYREGGLESRNFQLSNIETSDMVRNDAFQNIGENVYSRFITMTGQVENTWVKAPKEIIEVINIVDFENIEGVGLVISDEEGGQVPEIIDTECEFWASTTPIKSED
jgi:hypothetical protein